MYLTHYVPTDGLWSCLKRVNTMNIFASSLRPTPLLPLPATQGGGWGGGF